jgi:hypothetical protein
MRARGPEVAAAGPQGDFTQLEMREEFVPFGGGQITVFFTRPLGPAAGDERPMMGDYVFGVDRLWRRRISQLSECPQLINRSSPTTAPFADAFRPIAWSRLAAIRIPASR